MQKNTNSATLRVTANQLRVIQKALDFYSRVGTGQMSAIVNHPTYERALYDSLRPSKEIEVGDRTERGVVTAIDNDMIQTMGVWTGKEELRWFDKKDVQLSVDYSQFHFIRDVAEKQLNLGRNMLLKRNLSDNSSYGIHSPAVDESCRIAFDIVKVIRHEIWKANEDKTHYSVDSSLHLSTQDSDKISVDLH